MQAVHPVHRHRRRLTPPVLAGLGALLLVATLACRPSAGPAPAVPVITPTPAPTVAVAVTTPTPAATPVASPAAGTTPETGATPVAATPAPVVVSGNLRISSPAPGDRVGPEVVVQGEARAYEALVDLAVLDTTGRVIVQQRASASAGAPEWGTFAARLTLPAGTSGALRVRIATLNARDGGLQDQLLVDVVAGP